MIAILVWYLWIQVVAWAIFPFVARALCSTPDRGHALTKALGLLIVAYVSWALVRLGICRFDGANLRGLVLLLGAGGLALVLDTLRRGSLTAKPRSLARAWADAAPIVRHILVAEALFLGTFLFCVFCRTQQPEIFWGEKPMDFTFLNYFFRLETMPVEDPWAAGRPMRYYYLGNWIFAALMKATGVRTGVGYNLAMATIPALLVTSSYGVLLQLIGRGRRSALYAAIGAVAMLLCGNVEALRLAWTGEKGWSFDLFWATSRVLKEAMATEYPLWSFLFADLHAHVMALPFSITALGMALAVALERNGALSREGLGARLLLGLAWGSLGALNTWDFISYSVVFGLLLVCLPVRPGRWLAIEATIATISAVGVVAVAALFLLPFLPSLRGGDSSHGFVIGDFDNLDQIFRVLSQFLIPLLVVLGTLAARRLGRSPRSMPTAIWRRRFAVPTVLALAPILIGAFTAQPVPPLPLLCFGGLLNFIAAATLFSSARQGLRAVALLTLTASTLMVTSEIYWLIDRLNTLFKVYYAVWPLLALATGALLPQAALFAASLHRYLRLKPWRQPEPRLSRAFGYLVTFSGVLAVSGALAGGLFAIKIMTTFQRIGGPRPTLDGTAYLPAHRPSEANLIDWINANVRGIPVVAEAQGESYGEYTRIAMHTGLPTVLGWEYHVKQRGTPDDEIYLRRIALKEIYTSPTAERAHELLRKYKVSLLVVGDLEKRTYKGYGMGKFATTPDLFREVFRNSEIALYAVAGGELYPAPGDAAPPRTVSGR